MLIPYQKLKHDTLIALIEAFIDREGTDYGELEIHRDAMINQVLQQLRSGKVVICFDSDSESCNIITAKQAQDIGDSHD